MNQPTNILESILYGLKMVNDNIVMVSDNLKDTMDKISEIYSSLKFEEGQNPVSPENAKDGNNSNIE